MNKDYSLLGYDVMPTGKFLPTFRRSLMPPSLQ